MNAKQLVKKLGNKLLGKKPDTPSTAAVAPDANAAAPAVQPPALPLLDLMGVIQLHPHWRN